MSSDTYEKLEEDILEERILRLIAEEDFSRLDTFLSENMSGLSRTHIKKIIDQGEVSINKKKAKPSSKVKKGDSLVINIPIPEPSDIPAEKIPLNIVFEDDSIIVINKQKDLIVHPTANRTSGTLVNALLYHCKNSLSGIGGVMRPGIVHRLDKETSGIILVAKNDSAHIDLSEQIKNRVVEKYYTAFVNGRVENLEGEVDAPIGRDPKNRKRMAVVASGGKSAQTDYFVLEKFLCFTHLDLRLHTGRTHQIRVHLSHIGHPVAGDPTYGGMRVKGLHGESKVVKERMNEAMGLLKGQALHARQMAFTHPMTGEPMRFSAPLPDDISNFYEFLKAGDKN